MFETIPTYGIDDLQLPLYAFTLHQVPEQRAGWHAGSQQPRERQVLTGNFTREQYLAAVEKAIDYIAAGDIFQVNLSQRFTAALTEHPSRIYDRLRRDSPATYGAYLDHLDYALLCNSPELFLRIERDPDSGLRRVITRPIKGTRAATGGHGISASRQRKRPGRAEHDHRPGAQTTWAGCARSGA